MTSLQSNTAMRIYMALTALVGWLALLLQFPLTIAISRANGMSMVGAIITYFSFFTILTNLLVVLGLTYSLWMPSSRGGRFFSRPVVIAGITVYIAMVGAGYSLLLRHLWAPEGLQKIADVILHDLVPVFYAGYWLIFVPKSALRWKNVLLWLTYPLAYLGFVLLRGALSGRYPYPFIDAGALGYARVFFNAALLLCAFLTVGLVLVAISRCMGRASATADRQVS
jgi:hypothetical protein